MSRVISVECSFRCFRHRRWDGGFPGCTAGDSACHHERAAGFHDRYPEDRWGELPCVSCSLAQFPPVDGAHCDVIGDCDRASRAHCSSELPAVCKQQWQERDVRDYRWSRSARWDLKGLLVRTVCPASKDRPWITHCCRDSHARRPALYFRGNRAEGCVGAVDIPPVCAIPRPGRKRECRSLSHDLHERISSASADAIGVEIPARAPFA
jgi:hypothetical protein